MRGKPTPGKDIITGAAVGHTELSTRGSFSCATVGIHNLLSWDLLFVLL